MPKPCKIVVFDMDETLGQFVELGIFIDSLEMYLGKELNQYEFNRVMGLFPEFLRPGILSILKFVLTKKKAGKCNKIMIYTNNNGEKKWTYRIKDYFNYHFNTNVFDQAICAYKVNGRQIELCRTTYNKTVEDLINCTKLPENTQICFIDDQYHEQMINDNVVYIHAAPYKMALPFNEMASRYANKYNIKDSDFIPFIISNMNKYRYRVLSKTKEEKSVDKLIGKEMFKHIKNFFKSSKIPQTRKRIKHKKNKTFKWI